MSVSCRKIMAATTPVQWMQRSLKKGSSGVDRSELTGQHRLHVGEIALAAKPGEGYISDARRNHGTIQQHQEMLDVLSLGL